ANRGGGRGRRLDGQKMAGVREADEVAGAVVDHLDRIGAARRACRQPIVGRDGAADDVDGDRVADGNVVIEDGEGRRSLIHDADEAGYRGLENHDLAGAGVDGGSVDRGGGRGRGADRQGVAGVGEGGEIGGAVVDDLDDVEAAGDAARIGIAGL